MDTIRLMTPGPTPVPQAVLAAMATPFDHHRTAAHRSILQEITTGLQFAFRTNGSCLVITGSGTAAMEAAIVSTTPPGQRALVVVNGKFSSRWAQTCRVYGIETTPLELEWGSGASAELIERELENDPDIKTVIVTHSETTTAAVSDVEGIAKLTRDRDCLLVVDGITSVGAIPVETDQWGIDVIVASSQKAFMTPPGLGLVAVSEKAWSRIDTFEPACNYLNLKAYRQAAAKNDSPFTPAITLMKGLHCALAMMQNEGMERIWKRTAAQASAVRAAVNALGLTVFAKDPVDSLTAIAFPDRIDANVVRQALKDRYSYVVAGGQAQLQGRIIRVNHMGFVDDADTVGFVAALELVLQSLGHSVTPGQACAAAVAELASQ